MIEAVRNKSDEVMSHVSAEFRTLKAALGLNEDATAEQLDAQAAALRERARQRRAEDKKKAPR